MPPLTSLLPLAALLLASAALGDQPEAGTSKDPCVEPVEQDADWAVAWWRDRHEQKRAAARTAEIDLLMLGDSITEGWEGPGAAAWEAYYEDRNAFNLGFGGDRTEHVLWRLQHGAVDGLRPKLVVLMIGTNNTGHRMDPASCVAAGVGRIVDELRHRLPGTKVLLLAIFPRHESPDNEMRQRNEEINSRIAALDDGDTVHFMDVNSIFLRDDGELRKELMPDLLHPNAAGYDAWAEAMEPAVARLLE